MFKIKPSFRTLVHAKGDALLCLNFGITFKTVQLWIMEMVQRSRSWGGCQGLGPDLHVQTRPEEGAATCPKIKPTADPGNKGFSSATGLVSTS